MQCDYCSSPYCFKTSLLQELFFVIWSSFLSYQKVQQVQNSAARLITQSLRFCHIIPVLRDVHWLPVHLHIEFKILLIIYKALQGQAPTYIQEVLQPYQPSPNQRSSSRNLLVKPCFNLNPYIANRPFQLQDLI